MAARLYVLVRRPLAPAEVLAKLRRELDAADWAMSAEWAGYQDDDEAREVTGRLRAQMKVAATTTALELGFETTGAARFEVIGRERTRVLAEEQPELHPDWLGGAVDAVMVVLSGLADREGGVVRELASGMAIGLAGELGGALLDGKRLWDPAARAWR